VVTVKSAVFWIIKPCSSGEVDVSEEHIVFIFRVKVKPNEKLAEADDKLMAQLAACFCSFPACFTFLP
jgi:hypothetical protein